MTWALVNHNAVGFADGNGGHVYTLPSSAPNVGDLDILTVNSDTVVTMPSGFSLATQFVNSQGSYLWYRIAAGGEGSTVTITTAGNFDTTLTWSRWTGANAFDLAVNAHADGSAAATTPAVSTGTLATAGELVVAFAALHSPAGGQPTSPVWGGSYTALDSATQVAVTAFTAYITTAGTASESPSVSWTNTVFDRYVLVAAFSPAASGVPTVPGTVAVSTAGPAFGPTSAGSRLASMTSGGNA